MYNNPTITDFKAFFVRDFPYGTDPNENVLDQDIANAFVETGTIINPGLFGSQSAYTLGFELLAAHYLVMSLRSSSQGIAGQFSWLQSGRGVGSVSESISIPQRLLDNPEFAFLSKTNYGARYLMLILPNLTGQIYVSEGTTQP